MPTTVTNRKILDMKRWEWCAPAPTASVAGSFIASSRHFRQQQLFVTSNTVAHMYNPNEDGWVQMPSPALSGTFGAGASGVASAISLTGTATAGSASTLTTNITAARDIRGYSIHLTGGPGAGDTRTIASNTIGANSVITVTTPFSATPTVATTYRLIAPRFYVVGAGTLASGSFKAYDLITNAWTTLSNTGLPASLGTDGKLVATPSWDLTDYRAFATGTATSATATTLVNSAKTWTTNQWSNYQVRIVTGTGAGQVRSITSNTGTTLTVPTWTVTPDATSTYSIEGNDDYLYYIGNNAVTMYRYSISGNTWSTLAPSVARAGAPIAGMSANWVSTVTASDWTSESALINGRRIYSFRGGAATLDYYDIALNTWVNQTYSPATETFGTGSSYATNGDFLYIQKEATGRWFAYDFARSEMNGWGVSVYPHGAALIGDKTFDAVYVDGATTIAWVYTLLNTSTVMLRQMVI